MGFLFYQYEFAIATRNVAFVLEKQEICCFCWHCAIGLLLWFLDSLHHNWLSKVRASSPRWNLTSKTSRDVCFSNGINNANKVGNFWFYLSYALFYIVPNLGLLSVLEVRQLFLMFVHKIDVVSKLILIIYNEIIFWPDLAFCYHARTSTQWL